MGRKVVPVYKTHNSGHHQHSPLRLTTARFCFITSIHIKFISHSTMPAATTIASLPAAAESVLHTVDTSLRTFGYDLKGLVKYFDLQTVGLVTLVVVVGVFLFDLFTYGYSSYYGDTSTYSSYGRSLVTNAAKIWDQRDQLGFDNSFRGGRNLDEMTQILDSLADAVLKYEKLEHNEVGQTREAKVLL